VYIVRERKGEQLETNVECRSKNTPSNISGTHTSHPNASAYLSANSFGFLRFIPNTSVSTTTARFGLLAGCSADSEDPASAGVGAGWKYAPSWNAPLGSPVSSKPEMQREQRGVVIVQVVEGGGDG
jgi:hypothetical protein